MSRRQSVHPSQPTDWPGEALPVALPARDQAPANQQGLIELIVRIVLELIKAKTPEPGPEPEPEPKPPPPPPPPPPGVIDPVAATAQLSWRGSGCTCTILKGDWVPGKRLVLTAAHCISTDPTSSGLVRTKTGNTYQARRVVIDSTSDCAVLAIDTTDQLPGAEIAGSTPQPGTKIWHQGFGVDRPGNREEGEVIAGEGPDGQIEMRLSASSGDSGSGIFAADGGQIVSVVCCGSGSRLWGAAPPKINSAVSIAITRLQEQSIAWEWHPVSLPRRHH